MAKVGATIIVDNIAPENFTISVTNIKVDSFKITGDTIDNQSGIKDYTYVIEKGGVVTSANTNEEEAITETATKRVNHLFVFLFSFSIFVLYYYS